MKAKQERSFTIAFVVSEESLRRLDRIVRDGGGEPHYTLYCSDQSMLTPGSLDELLSFPNVDKRHVVRISLKTGYSTQPHFEVSMDATVSLGDSIRYTVEGEEKDVFYIADRIEEWVSSIRQPYSFFAFPSYGLGAMSWLLGLGLMTAANFHEKLGISIRLENWMFYSGVLIIAVLYCANFVRRWVFPVGIFGIGHGTKVLENLRVRQRNFSIIGLIGLVVAVIVGVVSSVIANHITK